VRNRHILFTFDNNTFCTRTEGLKVITVLYKGVINFTKCRLLHVYNNGVDNLQVVTCNNKTRSSIHGGSTTLTRKYVCPKSVVIYYSGMYLEIFIYINGFAPGFLALLITSVRPPLRNFTYIATLRCRMLDAAVFASQFEAIFCDVISITIIWWY